MTQERSYDELKEIADGRHVIVLGGYSKDYRPEDMAQIEQFVTDVVAQAKVDGKKVMVVIGATIPGIGESYALLKQKIQEAGLPQGQIVTAGIVSAMAKAENVPIAAGCDFVTYVDATGDATNGGSWEVKRDGQSLMVDIANHGKSSQFNYFGGGAVSVEEVKEAKERGFPVYVRDMPRADGNFAQMHAYLNPFEGAKRDGGWYEFLPPERSDLRDIVYGVHFNNG